MKILLHIGVFIAGFAVFVILPLDVVAQVMTTTSPSGVPALETASNSGIAAWLQLNGALLFAVLFSVSETLALIPSIKSNSVFQMIYGVLSNLAKKTP